MRVAPTIFRILGISVFAAGTLWGCGDSGSSADDAAAQTAAESAAAATARVAEAEASMPAGGYAPKLSMPSKRPEHVEVPLAEMFLKSAQVPPASDVNIPAYPGARIMSTMAGGRFDSSSGEGKQLPGMVLLSADDVDSVLAYYKEQLAGWQYQDFYGIHTFWNGPEDSNPLDIMAGHSMLSLSELEEGEVQRLLWPEMRSKIDMMYDKPGN